MMLWNVHMQTLDYRNLPTALNKAQIEYEPDAPTGSSSAIGIQGCRTGSAPMGISSIFWRFSARDRPSEARGTVVRLSELGREALFLSRSACDRVTQAAPTIAVLVAREAHPESHFARFPQRTGATADSTHEIFAVKRGVVRAGVALAVTASGVYCIGSTSIWS